MKVAQGFKSIEFRDILEEVSEEAILEYYTGINKIPCVINSPLRVDNNPSFGLYYSTNGIAWKHFALAKSGSLIDLLKEFLNIQNEQLKTRIKEDIKKIKSLDKYIIRDSKAKYERKSEAKRINTIKTLEVRVRELQEYDLKYWKQWGIDKEWLKFGKIYPIDYIIIGGIPMKADKFAYCYVEFKDGICSYKTYQPFSKTTKWFNNHNSSVWDLWEQIMQSDSDTLIITSSRKDALTLWANTGIPSTALQSENYLPKPQIIKQLQAKFSKIYCLYDNDYDKQINYGRNYGKKLSDLYGFKQIEIPEEYKSKDPSDLYRNYGNKKFKEILKTILYECS